MLDDDADGDVDVDDAVRAAVEVEVPSEMIGEGGDDEDVDKVT